MQRSAAVLVLLGTAGVVAAAAGWQGADGQQSGQRLALPLVARDGVAAPALSPSPATATPTPSPMATLTVVVLAGPTCPVEKPGDPFCADRPVEDAEIILRDAGGKEIEKVTGLKGGRGTLALAPGTYRLEPQPVPRLLGTPPAQTVTLVEGDARTVTFRYDTGIR